MTDVKKVVTPVFRISFPALFEAKAMEGSKPKYGCAAVFTPSKFSKSDKKRWKTVMALLDDASKAKFKKAWKDLPANIKRGMRDGAEKADLEGYGEGTRFANITSQMRPGVIDADKEPISPEHGNAEKIYPGCYCRATVTAYSYDNKGKGVALGLQNIQKVADGERLDSRTDAAEDFDDDIDDKWLDEAGDETDGDDDDEEIPF
jgi:hypothetical protein